MAQNTPKRKIKDSVFTNLFQDKKYLLRLYKALHPEDSNVTEEDIKDVTIKHILVDTEVKVLYQEDEGNIIGQYIIFCKVYNEQRRKYGQAKKAVTETIRICKSRNVLKEYLESKEQEVVDIMMTLFDDEQVLEAYAKDIDDNATHREARKTAKRMMKDGEALEKIARYVSLSMDELKELETEVMQLA
ncbi:MAG: hypothetical protein K1W34_18500 [Lachnospiraceae bacterium]